MALDDCGKTMPFIDTLYVTIEKEEVPRKEKFKQGYLDLPEIERPEWGVKFRSDADDSDAVQRQFAERGYQHGAAQDEALATWEPSIDRPPAFRPDLLMIEGPRDAQAHPWAVAEEDKAA